MITSDLHILQKDGCYIKIISPLYQMSLVDKKKLSLFRITLTTSAYRTTQQKRNKSGYLLSLYLEFICKIHVCTNTCCISDRKMHFYTNTCSLFWCCIDLFRLFAFSLYGRGCTHHLVDLYGETVQSSWLTVSCTTSLMPPLLQFQVDW